MDVPGPGRRATVSAMATLTVRVTPRSGRDEVVRLDDGVLHVRVTAPPVEGAANAAVTKLLAAALGIPARDVVLAGGASGRVKRFEVPLAQGEVVQRITAALAANR
jgi:uncharacterized protein (TIGR00251 family)